MNDQISKRRDETQAQENRIMYAYHTRSRAAYTKLQNTIIIEENRRAHHINSLGSSAQST